MITALESLPTTIAHLRTIATPGVDHRIMPFGIPALDDRLASRGLRAGALHEVKESEGGNDLHRHDIRALLRSLVDIVVQMHRLPPGDGQPARYRMTEVWFDPASKPHD